VSTPGVITVPGRRPVHRAVKRRGAAGAEQKNSEGEGVAAHFRTVQIDKFDSALTRRYPQAAGRALKSVFFAGLLALVTADPGYAQTPFPSFAYVVGRSPSVDLAGRGKTVGPDGLPDIWIAFIHRNLSTSLPHGGNGYHVKWMKLYQPTLPGYRWDTIPGSNNPLLVVTLDQGREVLNRKDGSVDGLNLAQEGRLDLFVSDPTFRMADRLEGLMLEVETTDGTIRVPVAPSSFYEHQY